MEEFQSQKFLIFSLVAVIAIVLVSNLISQDIATLVAGNLLYFPFATALAILAIAMSIRHGFTGSHGKAWFFLAISSVLLLAAEAVWGVNELVLDIDPYPSNADIFYVTGFISFFIFAVFYLQPVKKAITRQMKIGSIAVSVAIFIPTVIITFFTESAAMEFEEIVIAFGYTVIDAIIIAPAAIGVGLFFKGKVNLMWTLILLGMIVTAIADTLFLIGQMEDSYYTGNPFETLWIWAYVLFAFGVYSHYRLFSNKSVKANSA